MTKTPLVHLLLLLIAAALLPSPSLAEVKTLKITNDARPMILFEKFRFTHTGTVTITVSAVSVTSSLSRPDPSRLGFFLLSEKWRIQALLELQQNPNFCVVDSRYIYLLFTFRNLSPPPHSSFSKSYPVNFPSEYSLFFANCAPESQVSMDVRTEVYYLSPSLTQLPWLYSFFSIVYIAFLGFWCLNCIRNKRSVHRIHLLIGGLLVMKALNLICAAEDMRYVKVTGTPHGWDVLFHIFQFIRFVLLTVIVLIETGWSFLKLFLQEKGKKVVMIVIPLQVLANIASSVMRETGLFIKDWVTWNQLFLLVVVDIISCCVIIFPIVWLKWSLRETSKTDGKEARNLAKLTLFMQFYIVVIVYLYFTRIVVFALRTITAYNYENQLVSYAFEEVASLAFYMAMFNMFVMNECFVLDDEEEEAAEMALRDE